MLTDDPLDFLRRLGSVDVETARGMDFGRPSGAPDCVTPGSTPAQAPRGFDVRDADNVRILYPPRIEKLDASQDFNVNDYRVVLPAGVGSTVEPATLRFRVPADQIGWLQNFSLYTLTPTALLYASWAVLINGVPVPGFDDVRNSPGIANLVQVFKDDMRVRLTNGCTVSIRITNLDASGPWTVGGSLSGWYHPAVAEQRAWGINP